MRTEPSRALALGLTASKSFLVALAVALALGLGSPTMDRADSSSAQQQSYADARLERAMERHECSATGFGEDVIPRSALIQQEGEMERVSFDRGWAVYTGDEPGTLIAVCLR